MLRGYLVDAGFELAMGFSALELAPTDTFLAGSLKALGFGIGWGTVPIAVGVVAYGLMTRRYYRARSQDGETRCRKCGYILRGITEPRCPECGERI